MVGGDDRRASVVVGGTNESETECERTKVEREKERRGRGEMGRHRQW